MKLRVGKLSLAIGLGLTIVSVAGPVAAEKINCSNEYRSGKLYFSQELFKKAVEHFDLACEVCPDKAEYRGRYAMALCQYGSERLTSALIEILDPEMKRVALDSVVEMYSKAGDQFDAMVSLDDGKKAKKFVRENRKHFWVDRYNAGLKRYNDKEYETAELEFRLARNLDSKNVKAFSQGAIALIALDKKLDAAVLVKEGLAVDPEDERLNSLLEQIYIDVARELTVASEAEGDAAKAVEAVDYLDKVLQRRGGSDPDLFFERGVALLSAGTAESQDTTEDGESKATELFMEAADNFGKAAELVPPEGDNLDFHTAARFNQIQALLNAKNCEMGIEAIKKYLTLNYQESGIWQSWAVCLSLEDNSTGAVAALMASKSLAGDEISVDDVISNAKEDEKQAFDTLGRPVSVFTYQESGSGNQINTWFWPEKKKAMSFILGVKNGEMSW